MVRKGVDCLLDILSEELPTGAKQRKKVALEHLTNYSTNNRSADACRKQFEKLAHIDHSTAITRSYDKSNKQKSSIRQYNMKR